MQETGEMQKAWREPGTLMPATASKLLIADDHDLVRETLTGYLANAGGIEVKQAQCLDSALEQIRKHGPFDLVLLDFTMPGMTLPDGLSQALALNAPGPVALISGTASDAMGRRALDCGAAGFLPKTMAPDALLSAIRSIMSGGTHAPEAVMQADARDLPHDSLTPRERDVLERLCEAKSNKEIARDLNVQEVTIKLHVKTLSRKLNARNRTHVAMLARDMNLI
ncbi:MULTISPECIES: response regulator [Sediminimonas]|uniref:response regulator n=1 Tax=Sediminimonas TaxID=659427 RepID=UPI001FE038A1|nr:MULTISPECIES: response regulator transcription factor [Sediminimonas]MDR9484221.1 response regulator transcription factor [Sediminimonas sp.]